MASLTSTGTTTAFVNGSVFTGRPGHPWADSVVVRDGVIAHVGRRREAEKFLDDVGEVVDLRGGLLTPGFIDAHVHPMMGGLDRMRCDLSEHHDLQGYLEAIAAYVTAHPQRRWVLGSGWSMDAFPRGLPTAAALESAAGGRPVFLKNRDRHSAWVSAAALELAGIARATPNPEDGRIERDPEGEPTGCLHEGAMALVEQHIDPHTDSDLDEALRIAQVHLHSLGIVGWQDAALVGGPDGLPSLHEAYLRAERNGRLTARVTGAHFWNRDTPVSGIEAEVDRFAALRSGASGPRYRASSVKIMQDGVMETYTAALLEPYLDSCGCATDNFGLSFQEPELLRAVVAALTRAGFDLHFHALGDGAVRDVLDALELSRSDSQRHALRHHLAHLQLVDDSDLSRFRKLDVAANLQPFWAQPEAQIDELTTPFVGSGRALRMFPFGDLARSGTTLAMGSDWPVSTADPIAGLHVAVNRASQDGARTLGQGQELTLAHALSAYTAGSAFLGHLEQVSGVISEGMAADLVVLSEDPFAGPSDEIASARVERTYVGGELVFAAE